MKRKINLLITASVLGLIALSIIQGYLINNTYKLKKEAFIKETQRSISQIDDFSPALDSLSDFWQENFISDYFWREGGGRQTLNVRVRVQFMALNRKGRAPFQDFVWQQINRYHICFTF